MSIYMRQAAQAARRDAGDRAEFRAAARQFLELGYDRTDANAVEDFVGNRYANTVARAAKRSRDLDTARAWAYYIEGVTRALAAPTVEASTPTPKRRTPPPVKLASPTPRALSAERARDLDVGVILRMGDTRAIKVASYGSASWLIEPGNTRASDETVAGMGEWAVEAYAPAGKRYTEIVYLDLDGTGRKVYRAEASKYEVDRYEKAWKAYEAAKARGETLHTPSHIGVYRVQHAGREYLLTPESWIGVTDALAWTQLDGSRPTRRAEAQAKADRRALSPGALRALSVMVLAVLNDGRDRAPYPLTPTDLWRDLAQNRRNVFARLRDDHAISLGGWTETFTPEGDDAALLGDAEFSQRVGTRLIAGALRRLAADGWINERVRERDNAVGFVQSARTLPSAGMERLTGYASDAYRAEREADALAARLRHEHGGWDTRHGFAYTALPAWAALEAARAASHAARAAVAHPFATEADIDRLTAATTALRALTAPERA
jgi:hypothetical protein